MVMSLLVLRVLYVVFSGPVGSTSKQSQQAETEPRHTPEPVLVQLKPRRLPDGGF
jgi:hypothetical protein